MKEKNNQMETESKPAFEMIFKDGKHIKIYCNGKVEGFDNKDFIIVNRILQCLREEQGQEKILIKKLKKALIYATQEADGWYDDSRGSCLIDEKLDAIRLLVKGKTDNLSLLFPLRFNKE